MFQIKKLDPTSKRVSTIAGTGKAGFRDGTASAAQVGLIFRIIIYQNVQVLNIQLTV